MAVTFLLVFPLTHVIVSFFAAAFAAGVGVADAEGAGAGASCESLTLILGVEKVNPPAVILSQPSLSEITVVATEGVPSELETSIFA